MTFPLAVSIGTLDTTVVIVGTYAKQGPGVIQIGSEKILFLACSGNQFFGCTRAYASTSAAAHVAGVAVTDLSSSALRVSPMEFSGSGAPTDNIDGAGLAPNGARYTDTSSGNLYINTGSASATAWSQFKEGTTTLTDLSLTSMHTIIGDGTNHCKDSSLIRVDEGNSAVGINHAPDSSYKLRVDGPVYVAGSGSDLTVGRDIFVGNDNSGTLKTYRVSSKDSTNPLILNSGLLQSILFPPMTTTQKNGLAAQSAGCVVFDTTLGKLCVYNGVGWETITSA